MQFIQMLVLAAYLGTPFFIVYCWIRFAKMSPGKVGWPMSLALGLWLLQAAVLLYAISRCVSGHCTLTPLEEYGPIVLVVCAYLAIGWLLWSRWRRSGIVENDASLRDT
jgi:predicted transporter